MSAPDVIVIGAGPAGLAAAQSASDQGLRVLVIDEQAAAGGQIWRNASALKARSGPLAKSYRDAGEGLTALDNPRVTHARSATVLDVARAQEPEDNSAPVTVTWLSAAPEDRGIRETTARALVIATGALERPLLFPGATLPGVMGVGAVQSILKQSRLVPKGEGVVLAGQGPLLLLTLGQILAHGGTVSAVLDLSRSRAPGPDLLPALVSDPALMAQGLSLLWRARRSGVPWHRGITALQAEGTTRVERVNFAANGKPHSLPCALLAVHDGVIPNTQLTRLLALDHQWNARQQAFAAVTSPDGRTSAPGVWVAGDGAGIAGVDTACLRGALAGLDVARSLGALDASVADARSARLKRQIARKAPARAFVDRLYAPLPVDAFTAEMDADTIVCRCEAVTLARIKEAIRDGATGPNRVKTFTRCGMGACQGRMCGNALTRLTALETQTTPQDTGALRIRAPLKPTLISDYLESSAKEPAP